MKFNLKGRFALKSFILILSAVSVAADENVKLVTNHPLCTNIGHNLFKKGASVPEVFIAVSACEGLVYPQDSGLGGGFQAVIYNNSCTEKEKTIYLNAREKSPSIWPMPRSRTDFHNGVGIPGVLKGYEYLYTTKRCGYRPNLPWAKLFDDVIRLGKRGFEIPERLRSIYLSIPIFNVSDMTIVQNEKLVNTFERIAYEGPSSSLYKPNGYFYSAFAKTHVFDGVLGDLLKYNVVVSKPTTCTIYYPQKYTFYTSSLPGSGACICAGVKVLSVAMKKINETWGNDTSKFTDQHKLLLIQEVLKYMYLLQGHLKVSSPRFIYAQTNTVAAEIIKTMSRPVYEIPSHKPTNFGKITFNKFIPHTPFGTTNVVVQKGGVTMVATSTINWSFGSKNYMKDLGFFLNNQLYDFTYTNDHNHPNSPTPNAYPQSSISPTIILNGNKTVVLGVGAAGGSKIIGAVFQTIAHRIFENQTLYMALNGPRCIPKSEPKETTNVMACEPQMRNITSDLHGVYYSSESGYSAATAIDEESAVFDKRRGGAGIITQIRSKNAHIRKKKQLNNGKKITVNGKIDITNKNTDTKLKTITHCLDGYTWAQCKQNTICYLIHRKLVAIGMFRFTYNYEKCELNIKNINKLEALKINFKGHNSKRTNNLIANIIHNYLVSDTVDIVNKPTRHLYGKPMNTYYCVANYNLTKCMKNKKCTLLTQIMHQVELIDYKYNSKNCKLKIENIEEPTKITVIGDASNIKKIIAHQFILNNIKLLG